jgi:pilus assembly protein CpaE
MSAAMDVRILLGCDDQAVTSRLREVLLRNGLNCPTAHAMPLETLVDQAGRMAPELIVMVVGSRVESIQQVVREVCQSASAYVVVIGPAENPKLILRILHDGADEYLDEAQLESELTEAIIRFKNRKAAEVVEPQHEPGRVISVFGPSGGCGCSTLAASLATVLAKTYGECGLIDLRLTAGDLAPLFDLRPVRSIADLCDNLSRVDASMFEQCWTRHPSGVSLLAAPREAERAAGVTGRAVRQLLAMAQRKFPYVLADLGNTFDDPQVETLSRSDVVILVLRLDYLSVRNTRRAIERMTDLGIAIERVRLVVSRYGQRRQLSVGQAEEALGRKIEHFIPDDPSRVNRAINSGTPVVLLRPWARVSKCITLLASSVNGHASPSNRKRNIR